MTSSQDLLRYPWLRRMLVSRWPQYLIRAALLAGFGLVVLAGWWGTPVGNRNVAIVAVWIAWWAFLILVAVPFLGRAWCSVCPLPLPGEWLQNGSLLGPTSRRGWGRRLRWPRRWRNIWLQNIGFTGLALFSAVILTRPSVTATVLFALVVLGVVVSLVYERRAFCRYLCPIGGFIGLYAQSAPLELRVKDPAICAAHTEKACYTGNTQGYGCPWGTFPLGMVRNDVCGLCFECLRTCEYDNLALRLRPFGADLTQRRGAKLDEAFKVFLLLGSVVVYTAVFLGPWPQLKDAAYRIGTPLWWAYAFLLVVLTWGVLPGVFALLVFLARPRWPLRRSFTVLSYALVPLGLTAWAAFSLAFVGASATYLLPVLSDPFGWGWDLFGTTHVPWRPLWAEIIAPLQGVLLALGAFWSLRTAFRIARTWDMPRVVRPLSGFILAFTGGLLWLLVG